MSMQSYPFTSLVTYDDDGKPIYDRAVSAEFMRKFYKKDRCNGVIALNDSNVFIVTSVTPVAMKVRVLGGYCFINGAYGFDENSTDITISPASNQDRIDTIVLRLNEEFEDTGDEIGRSINIRVIEGTPSANPTAPALIRQGDLYDLGIANVYVKAGATSISQQDITDTRNNAERCGYSIPMQELDTTHITDQLQAQVDANVEIIQRAIDDTEASYLEEKISDIEDDVEDLQTDVSSLKNKKHIVSVTGTWTIGQLFGASEDTLYYVEQPIYFSGVKSTPNFEFTGYSIQGFVLVEKQTGYIYDFMKGYVYKGYDATSNKFQRVDLLDEDMYRTLKAKVEELKVQKARVLGNGGSTKATSAGGILIDKITGATQKTDIVKSVGDMGYFDGEWSVLAKDGSTVLYIRTNTFKAKVGDVLKATCYATKTALQIRSASNPTATLKSSSTDTLEYTVASDDEYFIVFRYDSGITDMNIFMSVTINGQYAIVVDEHSKNLWQDYAPRSFNTYVTDTNMTLKEICPMLKIGETYVLSVIGDSGNDYIYLAGSKYLWRSGTSIVMTQDHINSKVAVYGIDGGQTGIIKWQIEQGTTVTDYQDCQGSNRVYIPTSQPLHKDDNISKVDGKYKEYHKYGQVDLGSLNWSITSTGFKRTTNLKGLINAPASNVKPNIISDKYGVNAWDGQIAQDMTIAIKSDGTMDIAVTDTSVNPSGKLVYELATPTLTDCIDQSAFYQLESYAEQTIVDMVDNIGSMDISYGVTDTVSKAINGERLGYLANLDSGSSSGGEVGFIHTSSTEVAFERESVTGDVTFTTVKDGWYSLLIETVQAVGSRTIAIAINDINVCSLRLVGNTYDRTQITLPIKAGTTIKYKCTDYVACNCRATIIC